MLDEKDLLIIRRLEEDARTPITKIAAELGLSDVAIRKRLRKLEEGGVIRGYRAIVDNSKLGYRARAVIGFDLEPERLLGIVKELAQRPDVKWIAITSGDHMVLMEVWARDNDELAGFIRSLEEKHHAQRVRPAIVLDMVKY